MILIEVRIVVNLEKINNNDMADLGDLCRHMGMFISWKFNLTFKVCTLNIYISIKILDFKKNVLFDTEKE